MNSHLRSGSNFRAKNVVFLRYFRENFFSAFPSFFFFVFFFSLLFLCFLRNSHIIQDTNRIYMFVSIRKDNNNQNFQFRAHVTNVAHHSTESMICNDTKKPFTQVGQKLLGFSLENNLIINERMGGARENVSYRNCHLLKKA